MTLSSNIHRIQQLISQTEQSAHREPGSVHLLAVSKQQSSEILQEAFQLGLRQFGENYYQEAEEKIKLLAHLDISWHFIGPIQSNKTKGIARYFDWVHTINRLSIVERLNHYRSDNQSPLNVCIQVNVIDEPSKSGVSCQSAFELAKAISQCPNLKLRGLMTIPPPLTDLKAQYEVFNKLNELLHLINTKLNLRLDTLSMGMSEDMIPAIQAGSTIVRIGRALFGERIKKGESL